VPDFDSFTVLLDDNIAALVESLEDEHDIQLVPYNDSLDFALVESAGYKLNELGEEDSGLISVPKDRHDGEASSTLAKLADALGNKRVGCRHGVCGVREIKSKW
jgi:hypothetical protein